VAFKVSINGANYVSDAREKTFQEALEKREKLTLPANEGRSGENPSGKAVVQQAPTPASAPASAAPTAVKVKPNGANYARVLEALERGLQHSFNHQSETLRVHEQYLNNEAAYASIFAQLMQQQGDLVAQGVSSPQQLEATLKVLQSLSRSLDKFHDHQTETLNVHGEFLHQQSGYAQAFVDLLHQQYGGVLQGHGNGNGHHGNGHNGNGRDGNGHAGNGRHDQATDQGNGHGNGHDQAYGNHETELLAVVQDVTPVAGVWEEPGPDVVDIDSTPETAPETSLAPEIDPEALGGALLAIVSEKTGYPAEMLELDMDMEADLGIDSIKRVEILGALQEQYPDMPEVAPDVLAELRTLAQVLGYATEQLGAGAEANAAPAQEAPAADTAEAPEPSTPAPVEDDIDLSGDLLEIVSEKTGYPAEMLELDMDMEADLGIDSIKRVEILGALQEQHPGLPEVESDLLAELRTLRQVIDYMEQEGVALKKA
jgi:acyl carrier protein